MDNKPFYITAYDLAQKGKEHVPAEMQSSKHLIYSSPATLAFNSPGAQGFGVKRAGLAIPGSVMLLVSPGCCGRNTSGMYSVPYTECSPAQGADGSSDAGCCPGDAAYRGRYGDRFFYLLQDETDIVTGRHLDRIAQAVNEIVESLEECPTVVMICITCVDALLGTDMERVCRDAMEISGVPVLPCYMYALTREGRVPPMAAVRKTVYSLLDRRERDPRAVNLLGEFAPYDDGTELYEILKKLGVRTIREISRCGDFDEYLSMSEANFNIVLNPECRLAAEDFRKRLGIPSIELTRVYQIDKIQKQYELLEAALGKPIEDEEYYAEAMCAVDDFSEHFPETVFSIGEWLNADPFELSLALLRYGHRVAEIFGTVTDANFIYVRKIAELSPDTRIYSNLSPTMLNYNCGEGSPDITIGQDAAYYHPGVQNIPWNAENKPFGYTGLRDLFYVLSKTMDSQADSI